MRSIGSFEAKTNFSKLLVDVSQGEKIYITKRGKPVALLVPVDDHQTSEIAEVIERMRVLRKKCNKHHKITLSEINQMKEEGRR